MKYMLINVEYASLCDRNRTRFSEKGRVLVIFLQQ